LVATTWLKRITVVAMATLLSGCNLLSNDSSTAPTTATTESFSGTLQPQSSAFYAFTVSTAGPVSVTLTSFGTTTTTGVGLGIGAPNGTASCTLASFTNSAIAGTAPQITVNENPGTFCAEIYDPGGLAAASAFTITVSHS
jgi:hypothetical protein